MKSFIFRLQVLLDQASREEEEQVLALAELQRRHAEALQRLTLAAAARTDLLTRMQLEQQRACLPCDLQRAYLRLDVLTGECRCREQETQELDLAAQAQQARVIEAMRKRQVFERLREKQAEAHRIAGEQLEHKSMEETVLPRYNRELAQAQALIRQATATALRETVG